VTWGMMRTSAPFGDRVGLYVAGVMLSVVIQECARFALWWALSKMMNSLQELARDTPKGRLTALERVEIALAAGCGHAWATALFFFVSFLQLSYGHKSLRSPACVALNAFLAQALNCLGMTLLHMSLMVVFVMGMESAFGFRSRPATLLGMFEPLSVPFAHLAVALVTVASLQDGGCRGAIPVVVIAGVASVAWATVVARRRLARGALGARGDDLSAVVQLTGSQVPSAPVQ